jgi:phosphonate transport system substrate-binding protein
MMRHIAIIAAIGLAPAQAFAGPASLGSLTRPLTMILQAKLDPIRDLAAIRMTDSHANSLAALTQGQVDAASLSLDSYEKAVNQGTIASGQYRIVARSVLTPNPPLGMSNRLPSAMKLKLKAAFTNVAHAPGVSPDKIRGYGGKTVDGYDTAFPEQKYAVAAQLMSQIDDGLKGEILKKASKPRPASFYSL